ncbi:MAG: DUF1015 family protein [Nocardioides sp.]
MDSHAVVTPPYVGGPLQLHPFEALHLTPSRIGDPASARAFARPYRDVAARLTRWQRRGMIHRDDQPGLYLHEYTVSGITVRGLVGALDVSRRATDPHGCAVLPHEGIYPAHADDIADRMGEMGLNPAPILLVQESPASLRSLLRSVRAQPPHRTFADRLDQKHQIWTISDPNLMSLIADELAPTQAVIADGHHRYAAYLRLQQRHPGGALDRGLAMLVDQGDTPLFLGAIHRVLVGTSVNDVTAAASALGLDFRVTDREGAVSSLGRGALVVTDNSAWAVVTVPLRPDRLEVDVLHQLLVPTLRHGPAGITYHHAVGDALMHAEPTHGTAVLMPAPTFAQIQSTVQSGRLFPEKATSFQPKPALGVLIRSFRDEEASPPSPPPPPGTPSTPTHSGRTDA